MITRLRIVSLVLAACLWSASVTAQTRATLRGNVTDGTRAVLPGATVVLQSPDLVGGAQEARTDADGLYRFSDLAPGTYELTASLGGFQTVRRTGLRLAFGATATVDLQLGVASVSETVTVEEAAPVVDTTSSAATTRLETEQIQNLPITNRRQGFEIMSLAPGVASRSGFGSARDSNEIMIDGIATTVPQRSGVNSANSNLNWMEEVQVVGLGAPAEYGEFSGVVVNMVMRSGSNDWSGLVDYRVSRPQWSADNRGRLPAALQATFTPQRTLTDWESSAQLGGPILKDRLFFFGGFRYLHLEQLQAGSIGNVPRNERYPNVIGKLNWAVSKAVRAEGSFIWDRARVTGSNASPTVAPEATNVTSTGKSLWRGRVTWTPDSSTLFEARYGGLDYLQTVDATPPATADAPFTRVERSTGVRFSNAAQVRTQEGPRHNLQLAATRYASGFGKSHALKVGFEYENSSFQETVNFPGGRNFTDFNGVPEQVVLWAGDSTKGSGRRYTFYAQDIWQITDRIAVQPGLRYSINRGRTEDRGTVFRTNPLSPRLGASWDVTGDHRTLVRGHWGRFHDGLYTSQFEFMNAAGINPQITARVLADGSFQELSRTAAATNFGIDPALTHSYVDQVVVGVERELFANFAVTAQYIRRDYRNTMAFIDTGSRYAPVALRDPGPDGRAATADDGDLVTVFNLQNPGQSFIQLTNPEDAFRRFDGFQLLAKKRFSRNWQLQASYTHGDTRGTVNNSQGANAAFGNATGRTGAYTNPNLRINDEGPSDFDFTHMLQLQGTYRVPYWGGLNLSAYYNLRSGQPFARTAVFRLPTQGNQTVLVEPRGTRRGDTIKSLDMRIEKTFPLPREAAIGVFADIFNVFNSGVATGFRAASGPTFGQPSGFTDPRSATVAARLTF